MTRLFSVLTLCASALLAGCSTQLSTGAALGSGAMVAPPAAPHATGAAQASASLSVDVSFYGIAIPSDGEVVFVLDRSGSMNLTTAGISGRAAGMSRTQSLLTSVGGTIANHAAGSPLPSKLEAAKSELLRTISRMPDGSRVGIVFFDSKVETISPQLTVLTPASRQRIAAFVRRIEPGGSTAARPALDAAYRMGPRQIVLLSDGLANNGGNRDRVLAAAQPHIQRGLRIDTVGVGLDQDDALLQSLSQRSGGVSVMR